MNITYNMSKENEMSIKMVNNDCKNMQVYVN